MKAWVEGRSEGPLFIVEAGPIGSKHGISIAGAVFMGDELSDYPDDTQAKVREGFVHWFSHRGATENAFYDATDWRALGELIDFPELWSLVDEKRAVERDLSYDPAFNPPDYRVRMKSDEFGDV